MQTRKAQLFRDKETFTHLALKWLRSQQRPRPIKPLPQLGGLGKPAAKTIAGEGLEAA